jgi:hypothetical protein
MPVNYFIPRKCSRWNRVKFPADKNFPFSAVESLRDEGFDIDWASDNQPGASTKSQRFAISAIRSQSKWTGYFSVVTRTRVRMTLLPTQWQPGNHSAQPTSQYAPHDLSSGSKSPLVSA